MPLWVSLVLSWALSVCAVITTMAVMTMLRPDWARNTFRVMVWAVVALTPLPVISSFLSGDPTPACCGIAQSAFFLYILNKRDGGRRRKVRKLLGAKARAARAKLVAAMPKPRPAGKPVTA